jgi:hypothetical protein
MAKLTQEDISRLQKKGITIGATVTCARIPNDEIKIESWDYFVNDGDDVIKSIDLIDRRKTTYLFLQSKNKYATVVKPAPSAPKKLPIWAFANVFSKTICSPNKPEPSYEVDWTHAPQWANYHAFTCEGKGYWAQHVRLTNNSWVICGKNHSSGFVINLKTNSINTKKSITSRPEERKDYSRFDGFIAHICSTDIVELTDYWDLKIADAYRSLRKSWNQYEGLSSQITPKTQQTATAMLNTDSIDFNVDWTHAPKWALYHAFDQFGIGFWFSHFPSPINGSWGIIHGGSQIEKSGYRESENLNLWDKSRTERDSIDKKIAKAQAELDKLKKIKEREQPIEINKITIESYNKDVFVGFAKAPSGLEARCLMFKTKELELRTQQHTDEGITYTVLTFHRK